MPSFSILDGRRGCKNLTVSSVQSTQRMWRPHLTALVALFALVQAPLSSQAAGEKKLEVFSWWTSGGEATALDALFTVYKKHHPGVEIVNATVVAFQHALNDTVATFILDKNVDNFAKALVQAAKESGATK